MAQSVNARNKSGRMGEVTGWLLRILRGGSYVHPTAKKQLHVVETLPLGGKVRLMLVECATERFLVGSNSESIEVIVPVRPERCVEEVADRGADANSA